MPRNDLNPGSPAYWLRTARADLAHARGEVHEELPAFNCFHAQQAAERSIKAIHVHLGLNFAAIHDIQKLLTDLPADIAVPTEVEDAVILTKYAVASRYGTIEQPDLDDLSHAIHLAEAVYKWAGEIVNGDPTAR